MPMPILTNETEARHPPDAAHVDAPPYPRAWTLFAVLAGCLDPIIGLYAHIAGIFVRSRVPPRANTPMRRRRGLTLVVGGIEGPSAANRSMAMGVLRSGYRGAVARFHWNRGPPLLRMAINLMSRRHHEFRSDELVQQIVDHLREHPTAPVNLLAQSGGCWIVVRALEKLPPGITVQSAVLLAPAISPGYDIQRAAERCDRALVSIGAPGDILLLGLGTTLFGTSDRVHTPAAGWVGWHHHPERFRELRWHPRWIRHGFLGNHVTSGAARFVARVVARYFAPSPRNGSKSTVLPAKSGSGPC